MERSRLVPHQGWKLLLICVMLLPATFIVTGVKATAQTPLCDSLTVTTQANDNCCFTLILGNRQHSAFVNRVTLNVSSGYSITNVGGPLSSPPTSNGVTASWTFPNGVPERTDALRACFAPNPGTHANGSFTAVINWYADSTRFLCSDTLNLQCSGRQDSVCLAMIEQAIQCRPEAANPQNVWNWSFNVQNLSSFYARGYEMIVLSPQGISLSPAGHQQPTGIGGNELFPRHNAVITGGQPGQTVQILIRMCGSSTPITDDVICCEQIIEIRLPDCPAPSSCLEIVNPEIACDSAGYIWCFNVRNKANWSMAGINIPPMGNNAVITPGTVQFNMPIQPGGLSDRICVRIAGARPGRLALLVNNCADRLDICCNDSVTLELPECELIHRDCCDGFIINFANATPVAAPNGLTALIGLVNAGPNPITKVSATLVSTSINGQPAYGYFNSGTILNPLAAGIVTPPPFGQEVIWNAPAGVPMNTPSIFLNWLRLPPMAPNTRLDTASFCIRWRFTDANCRTCDTLICYTVLRNQLFFNTSTRTQHEKANTVLGTDGNIDGKLTGDNSAILTIDFPQLPVEQVGQLSFTGIKIQADDNVIIDNVSTNDPNTTFSTLHGLASAEFNANPGEQLQLNINYSNLNARKALAHFLLISYHSSLMPGVEQQIPLSVTLRQDGVPTGGDQIEAVRVDVQKREIVQTFALHLRNTNTTAEALSGLRITAGDGVKFLAVGPTSSQSEALLRFGAEGDGGQPYVSEASEGTMTLAPGAERNPIYVTVAMDEEADPLIRYNTLNELDETVSEGELNLSQISSVASDGGVSGSSMSLSQSAPNPTTGQVTISLRLSVAERVSLVVRDVKGREVMRLLDNERLSSGTHVVSGDVSGLANGTYFYTLESGSGQETRKMIIAK